MIEYTFFPDEIRNQLPPLYTTERDPDPIGVCKFFTPDSFWTWFCIEFDGTDTFSAT